jgi:alpha-beta hydrolase superfamily lysophospholipase
MMHRAKSLLATLGIICALLSSAPIRGQVPEENLQEICVKILMGMGASDWKVRDIHQLADYRYPQDPLSRAVMIAKSGDLGRNMVPLTYVAPRKITLSEKRRGLKTVETAPHIIPVSGDTQYRSLRIVPDRDLNSLHFISVRDRARDQPQTVAFSGPDKEKLDYTFFPYKPHEGTQIIVPWFAGHSTVNSHASRVFRALEISNAPSAALAPLGLLDNVGKNWVNTSALSIDVPLHGTGPFEEKYFDAPAALQWRKDYFQKLKKFGLPVVPGARSSECMLTAQVALENPGLIKAMIWLGPTHPVAGFKEGLEGYHKVTDEFPPFISPKGLGEVLQVRHQLVSSSGPKWWTAENWKTPVLILVGSEDIEVPEKSRMAFREWAKKFPDIVHYVEIPGAAHDPFSVSGDGSQGRRASDKAAKERAQKAWEHVYWFLNKHGLEHDAASF